MYRSILRSLALGAFVFSAGALFGQNKSAPAAAPAPAPAAPPQKLVKVATLHTVEANREFQANVQLLQSQRQAAVELNAAMEKEKDAKKKADMKKQLDQIMAKLNENNDAMQKAYGFSLARNYSMEIEKANIYMFVTNEEAATIEKAQAAEAAKAAADAKKSEKKKK